MSTHLKHRLAQGKQPCGFEVLGFAETQSFALRQPGPRYLAALLAFPFYLLFQMPYTRRSINDDGIIQYQEPQRNAKNAYLCATCLLPPSSSFVDQPKKQ